MKRTLSLVLALVMVLGTFTTVLAEEVNTEVEAGLLLGGLGVLEGDQDGNLMLEDGLKRKDLVVMLSRLMGEEETAETFPGAEGILTFEDVRDEEGNIKNDYYASFLAWAVSNELIKGRSETEFGYDEEVSIRDYAVVLFRVLEYDEPAWADVMEQAVELGLVEDAELVDFTRGTMALMTEKALYTKVKDSDLTLAEKLEIEMPAPAVPAVLEVDEVVADNLKEVKVMFNKDVDVDLEDTELFSIKGLTVEDAVMEDNVLVLSIEKKMANNKDYKLVVKGTDEVDGTYEFKAYDNQVPYVVEVQSLGTKAIKVILSEPVQKVSTSDFRLNGKTLYAGLTVKEGKEIILRPYTELSLGEHELTVKNLKDYNNFISLESNHKFEVAEDTDAPTVVDVSATLEKVVVEFSEDVDPNTVKDKSVYWMEGSVKRYANNHKALAGNKFEFTFTKYALPVYETTVYVTGVKDYSGNEMKSAEIPVKAVIDETRPEVVSAELDTDNETVIVKFNKPVNTNKGTDDTDNSALNLDNYRILDDKDNKILISTVTPYKDNNKEFKLLLGKELSDNKAYTIKISGIQDRNKYANTMYDYNGNIAVGVVGLPEVKSVSRNHYKDKNSGDYVNEITILFSRDMDLATVADPTNYIVKIDNVIKPLTDIDGYIDVIKGDGTLVKVFIETEKVEITTEIGVLGVKDTNGKKLKDYGIMKDLEKEDVLKITKAVATAKNKVKVTFNQEIAKADESIFTVGGIKVTEVEGLDSKTLTLTLATKLEADIKADGSKVTLGIYKEGTEKDIVTLLGKEFKVSELEDNYDIIKDEIAPEFTKAVATEVYGNVVQITLEFDEALKINENLAAAAAKDITVIRVKGAAKKGFEIANTEALASENGSNEIVLQIHGETVDSDYTVAIKKDSDWLQDLAGNSVVEKTRRTVPVTGVAAINKPAEDAVAKAEGSKKQEDKDAAEVLVTALPVGNFKIALQARLNAIEVPVTPVP